MSVETQSNTGYPEVPESLPDRLETAAGVQGTANTNMKDARKRIAGNKQQIEYLQGEVSKDEVRLPELILEQQGADDQVNSLLLEVEDEYHLEVRRIKAPDVVVQGEKAQFKAVHDQLPRAIRVKVVWDTGGCPFIEEPNDTITVDTSAAAPGDYDISASFVLDPAAAKVNSGNTTYKAVENPFPKDD